jgi:hypothetical protein
MTPLMGGVIVTQPPPAQWSSCRYTAPCPSCGGIVRWHGRLDNPDSLYPTTLLCVEDHEPCGPCPCRHCRGAP